MSSTQVRVFAGHLSRYAMGVMATLVGLLLYLAITAYVGPGLPPYITFFPAVMVVALLAGFGPGLFTTATAAWVANYWLFPRIDPPGPANPAEHAGLALFCVMGIFTSAVAELYRRRRQQATDLVQELAWQQGHPGRWHGSQQELLTGAGLVLSLGMLAAVVWLSQRSMTTMMEADRWATHHYAVVQELERLHSAAQDVETGQRGFLISGQERSLEPYQSGLNQVDVSLLALQQFMGEDPRLKPRLANVRAVVQGVLMGAKATVEMRRAGGLEPTGLVQALDKTEAAMDELHKRVGETQKEELALLRARTAAKEASVRQTLRILWVGWLVATSILSVVFVLLRRENARRLGAEAALLRHQNDLQATVAARTEELRTSEERVRQAMQVGRMFAFDWDVESDLVVRSPHSAEILGLNGDATRETGKAHLARVHPADRERFGAQVRQVNPAAPSYRATYRVVRTDASVLVLEEAGRGFFDAEGRLRRVVGIAADVTAREETQRALQWELSVNAAVSRVSMPLISSGAGMEEMAEVVLAEALRLTSSRDGFVAFIDPHTGVLVCQTSGNLLWKKGQTGEDQRRVVFPAEIGGGYPGLLGLALRTRRGFYTNRPAREHPASKGLPDGHVPLDRLLAVPVLLEDEAVGQVVVANAPRDYTDEDFASLSRLTGHYALGIQQRRFSKALQSERDFVDAILATAGALVVVLDTQGRVVRFNKACEETTGYPLDEVVGKSFWELFVPPDEREGTRALFAQSVAGQYPSSSENVWVAKDGTRHRIAWSNTVLLDETRSIQHVISTGVDVTRTRETESKLHILTQAIDAGPSSVVITDGGGTIIYVNPTFAEMTGYSQAEVIGQNPRLWKSGRHPPGFYAELWQALKHGQTWRGEICNKKKNGEFFWIYSTICPIRNESGTIAHLVAVTVDITQRKLYEEALAQARQDLERKVLERTADLNNTIQTLHLEVQARRRAEEENQGLLEFERTVTEISTEFASLQPGQFDEVLQRGVKRLMDFLECDRAELAEFVGEEIRFSVRCHTASVPPPPAQLPASSLPWTVGRLRRGEKVVFSSVNTLPPEARKDQETYRSQGTRSLVAAPLVVAREMVGALVFANVRRERSWADSTVQRMRLLEDLFAGLLMRWRSERALGEAEARYHALADFMRDWEYWESPEGALFFCSPACERITGYPAQRFFVEPKLLTDLILPEDLGVWREHRCHKSRSPSARVVQFRIRRADGEVRWVDHSCQPLADDHGTFLGIRASNRDITAYKLNELETERLHEELTLMARTTTLDHLAASLAHELRQPLAAILSNAEAAQAFLAFDPPDLGEVRGALQDIVQSDERAGEVIRRLRALYRRSGHERGPLDLNKLIEETLGLLRSELLIRQVSARQELLPQLPPVAANRVEVQQVIMNLVMNAMDALSGREVEARRLFVLTAVDEQGQVRVSVRDSGPGIDRQVAERLFEPFVTTKESGMGMGLAIARSIVEAHGGRLWPSDNPEGGAIFHFTLPALRDEST